MSNIRERVGYRGLVLFWLGWVFLFIGITLIPAGPQEVTTLWHTLIPLPWRVLLWIVPAILALTAGARNYWTTTLQPYAFAMLTVPPTTRALSYVNAALIEESWLRIAGALVYFAIVIGILLFSGWPEPPITRGTAKAAKAAA